MRGRFLYNKLQNHKEIEHEKEIIKDIRSLERHRKRLQIRMNKVKRNSNINLLSELNKEYVLTINQIYRLTTTLYG